MIQALADNAWPLAYIGPGAGFAFLGSFLILLAALGLVIAAVLSWPFRVLIRLVSRRGKPRRKTGIRRVVIVGLDGLDPRRCERLMQEGRLPAFSRLRESGAFRRLFSTCPPISPVAWSSFMTGVNPGKHNIFDFLNRDLRALVPVLSSARIESAGKRKKPSVRGLRKSRPFWNILSDHGLFSTVLRVPITYPPEPFGGHLLSGMCVPDLLGTQGTFTAFTDGPIPDGSAGEGRYVGVSFDGDRARVELEGPPNPRHPDTALRLPLTMVRRRDKPELRIDVSGHKVHVPLGAYTDWITLEFPLGPFRKVSGICRFYLCALEPEFRLYVTPIHIDPARPALPISHPNVYAVYLAKLLGPYATLGLAEDTWARNEGVINDATFLEQVYAIHDEREKMFFHALRRTRRGLCVTVFDASDRIQHMFMRREQPTSAGTGKPLPETCEGVIDEMVERMDNLVGRTMERLRDDDVLIVLSDHGFTHFRRGVNLNAWLKNEGYLSVREGHEGDSYLDSIDWSRTRAYTFGLSGIYLNRRGRERHGIVTEEEVGRLKQDLMDKLRSLADPDTGKPVIRNLYDSAETYTGPYSENGPDIVVGFEDGYRASWESAVGKTCGSVFSDNTKAWDGDHCVDQSLVPGVFFSNRQVPDERKLRLMDVAPTVLNLFGIKPPAYMDGTSFTLDSSG